MYGRGIRIARTLHIAKRTEEAYVGWILAIPPAIVSLPTCSNRSRIVCLYWRSLKMSQQIGIPGIVRDGVVGPQSNQRLPEGTHVEIRLEPGDVPAGHKSEIEAWEKASDESWKCKPTDSFGNSIE